VTPATLRWALDHARSHAEASSVYVPEVV
jgi:hypothetical protein